MENASIEDFRSQLLEIFDSFPVGENPLEATTEDDLIKPVIEALGWRSYLTQQTTSSKGRKDVPDFLLFPNEEAKGKANQEKKQSDRCKCGISFLEAKAWNAPLDRKGKEADCVKGVPSTQMLRYLSRVEIHSDKKIQWGILTNGRHWRLYFQGAKSRSEEFLELDLPLILGIEGFDPGLFSREDLEAHNWLKVFYLIFCKQSFLTTRPGDFSFHDFALKEGRDWEAKVAQNISDTVFNEVFPQLARGLKEHDPSAPSSPDSHYLTELKNSALTFLYRLLFVLYAEDRNLLPANDDKYDDYGLRKRVREDIADRIDHQDTFSAVQDDYYRRVCNLFKAIDKGDASIGLPPYNGGLFDRESSALLNRAELPDAVFAPLLDRLSRREEGGKKKWINYRDLSVQQLGSIYERLLEFEIKIAEDGELSIAPNIFARKTSGSYYTPEPLVKLILEKAVGPLLDEKLELFHSKNKTLGSSRKPRKERIRELAKFDPSLAMLEIRVCDPAMGSGHFLVSLVDYLADRALESIAESEESVDWQDEKTPYTCPLTEKIRSIREQILEQADKNGWIVDEERLDDRHIVRRMILKRCVYGVDKNPMAVELAKVALWLHTFTVGAPLSFLDHHLRCGDSLFGEFVRGVEDYLQDRSSMFISSELAKAKQTAKGMAQIEEITDVGISEVRESAGKFGVIDSATMSLRTFFSFIHATFWIDTKSTESKRAVQSIFDEYDPVKLLSGKEKLSAAAPAEVQRILNLARELYEEEQFLHWEIIFPGVWDKWESAEPSGGFDAVIGNPPWDRIKLQEVEWFASRNKEIALAPRASDRKTLIKKLKDENDPLWQDYHKASERAKAMANTARIRGQFPLLSKGDINIYSLFVERAHRLIKPSGMVGLLTPSGIASDKTSSGFFKSISTTGRLAGLFDFENKKIFFPDIHASFKFCAYIAGGRERQFDKTEMAFFLHDTREINDPGRGFALSHEDFARVNPNTGTAPIFRTRRDAEITRRIYEKFPVLNDHRKGKVWPVKYFRMFDMTNDSHLFKTKEELEKAGFYPVEVNTLKKGDEEYRPLYVGRMINHYDHRAASVEVNLESLHNPALSDAVSKENHGNPGFYPTPQYWVHKTKIQLDKNIGWFLSFRDIARSTDARTMIATIIPRYPTGNKLPLLIPNSTDDIKLYKNFAHLLLCNLNTLIFDFVVRQKLQSTSLNWYIVEQLPVIPPAKFKEKIGGKKISDFIRGEVLKLTYTAYDMKPFALDMGYEGEPFVWDEDERRHGKARLDALFFLLYEMEEDEAAYILDAFPIVKREDERMFDGKYLTKELILAYMRTLKAGDTEAKIKL